MLNCLSLATSADTASILTRDGSPSATTTSSVERARQTDLAHALVKKMLDEEATWGDPTLRTASMTTMATVAMEIKDLDGTEVTVLPASASGSMERPADPPNSRTLRVLHSDKGMQSEVMVAITERFGCEITWVAFGQPGFEGFADLLCQVLKRRARGRQDELPSQDEFDQFRKSLRDALFRLVDVNPAEMLRLMRQDVRTR